MTTSLSAHIEILEMEIRTLKIQTKIRDLLSRAEARGATP